MQRGPRKSGAFVGKRRPGKPAVFHDKARRRVLPAEIKAQRDKGGFRAHPLAPLCKGSWQGRQALTEGLWVSCRNGITVTGYLLLHPTYNPSASHSLSTSPYTGEASPAGDERRGFAPSFPRLPSKKKRVYGRNMVPFPGANCAGGPFDQTASVAGKTGSLRHCAVLAARGRSRAARAGECRRPIFGNSFAGNLWNSRGPRKSAAFVGRGAAMAFPQKRPRSGGEARRRTKREAWLRLGMPYGGRPF